MSSPTAAPASEERIPRRARWAILAVVSVAFLAIGLYQAAVDAPTVDEGVDVSSGVSALVRHDLRMVPEHPPLPKVVAALPALLAQPIVPDTPAWEEGDWFDYSDDFIAANAQAGRLDEVLFLARAVVLVECLAAAALLYVLTTRFFGGDAGTVVAAAWLTTPYVVGLGHFAMIDIAFVVATLGVMVLLARWADHPTLARAALVGAGVAGALASRHTGLVLALIVVAVMAYRLRDDPRVAATTIATTGLVSVVGLWLVYRAIAPGGSSAQVTAQFQGLIDQTGEDSLPTRIVGSLPLPIEWRAGFAYLEATSTARPASLLGHSWDGGRWWFFPVSAALKIPLTLVAAIVGGWIVAARRHAARRALLTFVVLPALVLWLFLVAQPLNLGLRLAMPVVALAFVGLGALVQWRGPRPVLAAVALIVVAGQVASMATATRHALAWTPVPWHPSYQWVSDSSLDAGQALYEVRAWAEVHDAPHVALDSTRGLQVEGGSTSLGAADPADITGWVAAGVTPLMQTQRDELAWLRKYCPVDTIGGGSVLVYRFDVPPDAAPGPETPVSACFGDEYSSAR